MPGILVIWWKARWKIQHSEWLMAVSNILKYINIFQNWNTRKKRSLLAGKYLFVMPKLSHSHHSKCEFVSHEQVSTLLAIISTHKLATGSFTQFFLSIRIVLRWFYLLIFYFEKFTLESDDCHLLKERLSFTYTANGNRQIQVWISQNRK